MTYNVAVVREVLASPEKVWALVTDLPRMGEWSPENLGGEWLEGATCAAVGATFKGRNKNGKKKWGTNVVVNACDAPKKFSFGLMVLKKTGVIGCTRLSQPQQAAGSHTVGSITVVRSLHFWGRL